MIDSRVRLKKIAVILIGAIALSTFGTALALDSYWKESRGQPSPALGRVIEASDHGHKYYLTSAESRASELLFASGAALSLVAGFLNHRWQAFRG